MSSNDANGRIEVSHFSHDVDCLRKQLSVHKVMIGFLVDSECWKVSY